MLEIAQTFADLMDDMKYDESVSLMAEDCTYHYSEGNYSGARNIANIYKQNHLHSSKMFDEIRYSSEVEPLNAESVRIHLVDSVRIRDSWHNIRFDQILRFKDNLIVDIQDIQLRGEMESLREFYQKMQAGGAERA